MLVSKPSGHRKANVVVGPTLVIGETTYNVVEVITCDSAGDWFTDEWRSDFIVLPDEIEL